MATRKPLVIINGGVQEIPSGDTTAQAPATGPAGSNTEVQYNDSGAIAGDASFTWDKTNKNLSVSSQSDGIRINSNKVWHAGNDGTSSGLDADTVDGLEATSFVRTDADSTIDGYDITLTDTGGSPSKGVFSVRKIVASILSRFQSSLQIEGGATTQPSSGGVLALSSSTDKPDLSFHKNDGTRTAFVQTDPTNTNLVIGQEQNGASLIFRNKTGGGAVQDNEVVHAGNHTTIVDAEGTAVALAIALG